MNKISCTVVIPVKNEVTNIRHCLSLLTRFKHVVVVDSDSSDGTSKVVQSSSAEYINFVWDGRFPKKRNWVLLNYKFDTDWVLFLDADEFVTNDFCSEIEAKLAASHFEGYWLRYTNFFLGKRLRFGVPQRKLALLRIGAGLYENVNETAWSRFDMEIHEHPILRGKVGEILSPIEHQDFRSMSHFIRKHTEYIAWEAHRIDNIITKKQEFSVQMTIRQRVKYRLITKFWYAWAYFLYALIIRAGFLDGSAGFYYAFYKLWYFMSIRHEARSLVMVKKV